MSPTPKRRLVSKNPIVARLFVSVGVAVLCPLPALAAPVLADEAVRDALARPELQARVEAELDEARAGIDAATVRPTPSFEVTGDRIFGDINVGFVEVSASVEQRFDLSGWRKRLRGSLPHRESAVREGAKAWRVEVAALVRSAYFAVRYHELRLQVYDGWIERLEKGLANMEARAARGDAAAYHVRRVERELELARARQASEVAAMSEAWAQLQHWTGWRDEPELRSALPPPTRNEPGGDEVLTRPDLMQLQARERSLDAEARSWGSPWLRGWTVGAGYRFGQVGPSTGHGFVVSLSVPLALWNTHAPQVRRVRAEQARTRSELAVRTAFANTEVSGRAGRLRRVQAALAEMSDPSEDGELSHLAEVAFAAGEASLVELLDAFESEADLQLSRLDLQWDARRADIDLDQSLGLGVPQ